MYVTLYNTLEQNWDSVTCQFNYFNAGEESCRRHISIPWAQGKDILSLWEMRDDRWDIYFFYFVILTICFLSITIDWIVYTCNITTSLKCTQLVGPISIYFKDVLNKYKMIKFPFKNMNNIILGIRETNQKPLSS